VSSLETFLSAAIILLPLTYLLAALAYGWLFFAGTERAKRLSTPLLLTGLFLHVAFLAALTLHWAQFPAGDVSQALSVVAFAVGLTYLLVEWRGRDRSTGFWIVSVIFFIQLLSSMLRQPEAVAQSALLKNAIFAAHAFLALVAYAAFVMAAAYGFLFLRLYRELKSGLFALFYGKLPPLAALERMMAGALHIGWLALTGAVAIGIFNGYQRYGESGESWVADPMILLTLATWSLYGLALLLRRTQQWQGRQTAIVSVAGLCAILLSLVAVNFLVGNFHSLGPATGQT